MYKRQEKTAPVIEESYKRFLAIMERHLANSPYILGQKPSSADFAIFGQLTQLIGFDPTSRNIALEISKRTVAWINSMEDLSGLKTENNEVSHIIARKKTYYKIVNTVI